MRCHLLAAVAALLMFGGIARAELSVAPIFGDNMVLQREMPIRVWGVADKGTPVTVTIGKESANTTAVEGGEWAVTLPAIKEGKRLTMTVKAGTEERVFQNVAMGEVWICSGQSNMVWSLRQTNKGDEYAKNAANEDLRLSGGFWRAASPESVGSFSAVGYHFGNKLQRELGVPVGLIQRAVGGTAAELWTPKSAGAFSPETKAAIDARERARAEEEPARAAYAQIHWAWQKEVAAARAEKKPLPPEPPAPKLTKPWGELWTRHIAPVAGLSIRGVIWYQGEADAHAPDWYRTLFPSMIQGWRSEWAARRGEKQADFHFLFVQLPGIGKLPEALPPEPPADAGWAWIREAQTAALTLPNTGMVVTLDPELGGDLHPKEKLPIAQRLANLALHDVYKKDQVVAVGPTFEKAKVEGDAIRVTFKNIGGGLVMKGEKLEGFAIAGSDGKFMWADAVIEGATVVVKSAGVKEPVAVRYGWMGFPKASLFSKDGLPAGPFRTDNWPRVRAATKPAG